MCGQFSAISAQDSYVARSHGKRGTSPHRRARDPASQPVGPMLSCMHLSSAICAEPEKFRSLGDSGGEALAGQIKTQYSDQATNRLAGCLPADSEQADVMAFTHLRANCNKSQSDCACLRSVSYAVGRPHAGRVATAPKSPDLQLVAQWQWMQWFPITSCQRRLPSLKRCRCQ